MSKKEITVSINPWYFCNFRCNFCYLTKEQLGDRKRLDLSVLDTRLKELTEVFDVKLIDLYGGEIGLLPKSYIDELKRILFSHYIYNINVITNLSMVNDVILDPDFQISVSYDFESREKHEEVFNNMLMFPRPFSVLMLAGPDLIERDVGEMIYSFNLLNNLTCVDIKPYSSNQSNVLDIVYPQYEEFIKKWITSPVKKNFKLMNEQSIKMSLFKQKNSFSDDHVYITPSGNFAALEFDHNDNEYFLELQSVEEYLEWTVEEKRRVAANKFCSGCEYFGGCLSEHLKEVRSLDNSCNGFKHLLDWYKTSYIEEGAEWKVRQELFHQLTTEFTDDLSKVDVVFNDAPQDIILGAVKYFTDASIGWLYPAKSYVVAICYAKWLSKINNQDFYALLNDPGLLFHNDPHFKMYSENKAVYDEIISQVTLQFNETLGVIPDVRAYFNAEMFIDNTTDGTFNETNI